MIYEAWRISFQSSDGAARSAFCENKALRVKLLQLEADHESVAGKCEQLLAALKEARAAIVCRTFDETALSAIDAALALDDRDA